MHPVAAKRVIEQLWDALQAANPLLCGKGGNVIHDEYTNQIIGRQLDAAKLIYIGIVEPEFLQLQDWQDVEIYVLTENKNDDKTFSMADPEFAKSLSGELGKYGIKLPGDWWIAPSKHK